MSSCIPHIALACLLSAGQKLQLCETALQMDLASKPCVAAPEWVQRCLPGSVDGLVEASRQSRVCAGAANEVMCAVFRVLMEVRPRHKTHSNCCFWCNHSVTPSASAQGGDMSKCVVAHEILCPCSWCSYIWNCRVQFGPSAATF